MSRTIIKNNQIISCFTQRPDDNFSFSRDSDRNRVIRHFTSLARNLAIDPDCFVCAQQTHGTNVGVVTAKHKGTGVQKDLYFTDTDALVTNVPGIALLTVHADCIPVQLWDPVHKAVGSVHSGWKGTLGEIAAETVRVMHEAYGSDPADLTAAIGPGICQQCFEVSKDVYDCFLKKFPELCQDSEYVTTGKIPEKWHLNLKAFVRRSLMKAGVLPDNIDNSLPCTCCNEEEFFSHRRDSKKAAAGEDVVLAAMGSVIYIKGDI